MDVYGVSSAPEMFRIDDLLDFSNADIFSSSAVDDSSEHHHHHLPHSETTTTSSATGNYYFNPHSSADFTNDLCVPSEDAAELEWLSTFVEDSFSDIAANSTMMNLSSASNAAAFQGRCRSKRSRSGATGWTVAMQPPQEAAATVTHEISKHGGANNKKRDGSEDVPRRCTHCASEKTPQWRTGPLGPKTLCNACGVRYKSGRLVPEYRPAASPTFVLTQHSNSHRKVLELRRQKEMIHQQQQQQQQQEMYGRHFQVC